MDKIKYKTKQHDLILSFLESNANEHFTAEEIYQQLHDSGHSVGKTTVYRHLVQLEKDNKVRKYISDGDNGACYEYINCECSHNEHFHLKCQWCGDLIHLDCNYLHDLNNHVMSNHNFKIDYTKTVLYGKCSKCED